MIFSHAPYRNAVPTELKLVAFTQIRANGCGSVHAEPLVGDISLCCGHVRTTLLVEDKLLSVYTNLR